MMAEPVRSGGMNRRQFLGATAGATLAAGATGSAAAAQVDKPKRSPTDIVPLGKTGIRTSLVGFGTGTRGYNRQSNQTRLGFQALVGMLRHAYDSGIRLFDLADLYGSHVYVREALRFMERDKITILSKIWWRYGESPNTIVDRFRHELCTDYIDVVLLHCVTEPDWDKKLKPYMDMLSELKAKKQVRAVGTSCHQLAALKTAAASDWVDVDLARINPKAVKMDGPPEEVVPVLKQMKAAGKGVLGMKIFGEGKLVYMREESLKYVWGLGCVDAVSIGFQAREHIDDTLRMMDRVL